MTQMGRIFRIVGKTRFLILLIHLICVLCVEFSYKVPG